MLELTEIINSVAPGEASEFCRQLPAESIHAIVTSPPYYGQRAYSDDPREIGREPSLQEYVAQLVDLFDTAKDALRPDGTLWLNLGDKYVKRRLQGAPWRVALALQDAGWILRSDIIWHKPNAMPSSTRTRPTTDHEYLFLFTKTDNYFYDADAIREPHVTFSPDSKMRGGRNHFGVRGGTPEQGKNADNNNLHDGRWDQAFHPDGRNKRTVWSVPLGKCREAHFAVFPPKLIEPCILAGCPRGGVVLDPFMGSGTTGIVASQLGRNYIGVELSPEYVELARRRIAASEQKTSEQKTLFADD